MGNLEKAGVGVVVALLLIIMVVAFTADPQATEPIEEPKEDAALVLERETDSQESDALINPGSTRLVQPAPADLPERLTLPRLPKLPDAVNADADLPEHADPLKNPGVRSVRPVRPAPNDRSPSPVPSIPEKDVVKSSPVPAGWPKDVVVAKNDSLWRIAERAYGRRHADRMVPVVREFNGLKTDRLSIKQKLRLPAPPVTAPKLGKSSLVAGGAKPAADSSSGGVRVQPVLAGNLPWEPGPASYGGTSGTSGDGWYVVKRNESLGQIAQDQLGSVKRVVEIMKLNGIKNPDRISEGQRLKMPKRKK